MCLFLEKKILRFNTCEFEPTALRYWVDEQEARRAILGKIEDRGQKLDYQDYRLGFRKIASNTNIRTLISTIIPPNFCSENFQVALSFDEIGNRYISYSEMLFLCALFNSFCLDSVLRQRVSANINFFYIYQLSVPRLQEGDQWFAEIVERAAKLICTTPEFDELWQEVFPHPLTPSPKGGEGEQEGGLAPPSPSSRGGQEDGSAPLSRSGRGAGGEGATVRGVTDEVERAKLRAELDGIIAHLYGLTETEFAHILSTFPLVPDATKQAALQAYRELS